MTKKLTPQELEIGMVTAASIITPSGQLLSPAGVTLTKQLINKTYPHLCWLIP